MTTPKEATSEALPDLDKTRMLGYDAIRYVAGYPESYVKEYAVALLESERQAHAAEVERLRANAERYKLLRRGQHWSVIDGMGYTLRAEQIDAAIDQAIARGKT